MASKIKFLLPLLLLGLAGCGGGGGELEQFTVAVIKTGTGSGTVASSPAGISCGASCTGTFDQGAVLTLTATPAQGSSFVGWSGACSGTGTCQVTVNNNLQIGANFTSQQSLSVTRIGAGRVTSSPGGIDCGTTCTSLFTAGSQVVLTATPDAGAAFQGWSGACTNATGTCTVTMTQARQVTANFATSPVLTVSRTGPGTVTSTPAGINCGTACSAAFAQNSNVRLTATPDANRFFQGWTGCTPVAGTPTQCDVQMGGNRTVTAAFSPAPAEIVVLTTSNRLLTFDRAAPETIVTAATISGLQGGESIVGIDYRPASGVLYGVGSSNRVYQLNLITGAATAPVQLTGGSLSGNNFGVDFNPVADRLRVVSDTEQNIAIDVTTGAVTTNGAVGPGDRTVTAAAYTNSFSGATGTVLYDIDSGTNQLLIQNPAAGTLVPVGPLGVDPADTNGFDIAGSNLDALAALVVNGLPRLYQINLVNGAATLLGSIGGGETLRGMAIALAPAQAAPGDTFVITSSQAGQYNLISFDRSGNFPTRTFATITGLQANEAPAGMDFRTDGTLYLLTNQGRLYQLNPATAAASSPVTLVPDATDVTPPLFTGLSGSAFGVDFIPGARLRVVSDTGQNLRVNADDGLTIADGTLNRAAAPAQATAAGYTNAFPGATATTLYVIDPVNDQLAIQNPQNTGALTNVGPLNFDVDAINGFDIDGVTGEAFAALTVGGTPNLYAINLATGAATALDDPGTAGIQIYGLALAPPDAPVAFGVTTDNRLVSFSPTAPDTLTQDTAITGLPAGEQVRAIDFRRDGVLYGLTNATPPRLVRLNTATGAATVVAGLNQSLNDTPPFFGGALTGTLFSQSFDPNPALAQPGAAELRVVTNAGENLRVVPTTGETFTDGNLAHPRVALTPPRCSEDIAAQAVGLTHTRSNGSLYAVDTGTDCLYTVTGTSGAMAPVGALFAPAGSLLGNEAALDVAGAGDGLTLGAFEIVGSLSSVLHSVNLTTGQATPIGAIGPAGTPLIRALAVQLLPGS